MLKRLKTSLVILFFACGTCYANNSQSIERDSSLTVQYAKLQKVGDNILVSFNLKVDKYLDSNETIVITPTLFDKTSNIKEELPKIYINGRRQHVMFLRDFYNQADDVEFLKRDNGTTQFVDYLRMIPTQEWMSQSSLKLIEESCGCGLPMESSLSFVATMKSSIPEVLPKLVFIKPEVEQKKIRYEVGSALIEYPVNDTVIYPNFRQNQAELYKITKSIQVVTTDPNIELDLISIHGYASPEGSYENNERLSRGRTKSVQKYIDNKFKSEKINYQIESTPENWEGLEALISDTTFLEKKQVLDIIHDNNLSPDAKEAKLRKEYAKLFDFMSKNWFNILRRTDYVISYIIKPFSLEQSQEVFDNSPSDLSLDEMFILANSYEETSDRYNEIFIKAADLYPDSSIANLNAASISLSKKDTYQANRYLQKADQSPEKDFLVGVLYMLQGKYKESNTYLLRAKNAGISQAEEFLEMIDFYN